MTTILHIALFIVLLKTLLSIGGWFIYNNKFSNHSRGRYALSLKSQFICHLEITTLDTKTLSNRFLGDQYGLKLAHKLNQLIQNIYFYVIQKAKIQTSEIVCITFF